MGRWWKEVFEWESNGEICSFFVVSRSQVRVQGLNEVWVEASELEKPKTARLSERVTWRGEVETYPEGLVKQAIQSQSSWRLMKDTLTSHLDDFHWKLMSWRSQQINPSSSQTSRTPHYSPAPSRKQGEQDIVNWMLSEFQIFLSSFSFIACDFFAFSFHNCSSLKLICFPPQPRAERGKKSVQLPFQTRPAKYVRKEITCLLTSSVSRTRARVSRSALENFQLETIMNY